MVLHRPIETTSRKRHFEPAYKLPSGQKVSFRCVGEEEIATLRTWVPYAHKGSTTVQREAGKMAENALRDWNAAQREQLTAWPRTSLPSPSDEP